MSGSRLDSFGLASSPCVDRMLIRSVRPSVCSSPVRMSKFVIETVEKRWVRLASGTDVQSETDHGTKAKAEIPFMPLKSRLSFPNDDDHTSCDGVASPRIPSIEIKIYLRCRSLE